MIDPWSVLQTRGAEALRWYMFSSGSPWTPKRVFDDGIDEATQLLLTLWNAIVLRHLRQPRRLGADARRAAAPRTSSTAGSCRAERHHRSGHRRARRLRRARRRAGARRARRRPLELVRAPRRPRFWKSADPAAHATLHECLVTISQLLAPFCPFVTDEMYRIFSGTGSSGARRPTSLPHVPQRSTSNPPPAGVARACTCLIGRSSTRPASTTRSKPRWIRLGS